MFAFIRKRLPSKDRNVVKKNGKSTSTISELVVAPVINNQSYSDVDYLPMKAELFNPSQIKSSSFSSSPPDDSYVTSSDKSQMTNLIKRSS